ncbi:Mechanosensitive ion channel MscS [Macleaya cordata]|uniref:Mechanosensitive ion channel protein n=1 Tax=Macleaya cordata TaxID=56857 RepID=A0A200QMB6_MACCD|nr:Mechanosensitive ion channel MscS [Macleaya cordata]
MSTDLNGNSAAEGLKEANKKMVTDAVVLVIQGEEEEETAKEKYDISNDRPRISTSSFGSKSPEALAPQKPLTGSQSDVQISTYSGQTSPEITNFCPSLDKPLTGSNSPYMPSPDEDISPIMPRTPLMASPGPAVGGEEEEEEIYKIAKAQNKMESQRKKLKFLVLIEWTAFVCIMGTLISSLTVDKLEHFKILDLHLWKWCVLLLVIVSGRLFTEWFMNGLVFLIERNFLLKKKVLYFVYGLKNSVQVCIWLVLVLLSWVLLFHGRIKRSDHTNKILNYVTRALVSFLVGAVIWLIKTVLIMTLAASVNVRSFFDRIQESLYHQYVLQVLSGPPIMELAERIGYTSESLSFRSVKKRKVGGEQQVIDVAKLNKLKQDEVSSWTMKLLSDMVNATKLSTISNTVDEFYDEEDVQKDVEITSEWEAMAAAYQIFRNVAKPGCKYIYEEDLHRFLCKEEVWNVFPLFEGAVVTGKIKKSTLKNWVVNVYRERKSLALTLNDTKAAVKQLNKVVSILLLIMFFMVWLISMGLATTEVVLFISSQIFVFGNTTKAIFEGIIFVFYTHPFDVGDRCVIDGVQMIVEEMNIMTTVFLRYDNQKIYYPNVVLATKCIGNMYRSPDMGDAVEFVVDASTTVETIGALKARIKKYIESKPQHWNPQHRVVVLEIENVDKMKMALYVTHTMNHQDMEEKTNRRSDLILELKKIFEEFNMKYHLLPQEVPASYATM